MVLVATLGDSLYSIDVVLLYFVDRAMTAESGLCVVAFADYHLSVPQLFTQHNISYKTMGISLPPLLHNIPGVYCAGRFILNSDTYLY